MQKMKKGVNPNLERNREIFIGPRLTAPEARFRNLVHCDSFTLYVAQCKIAAFAGTEDRVCAWRCSDANLT